jgi:hypothetical protein
MDNSVLGVYFDMANELGMGWGWVGDRQNRSGWG